MWACEFFQGWHRNGHSDAFVGGTLFGFMLAVIALAVIEHIYTKNGWWGPSQELAETDPLAERLRQIDRGED